jgi:hypothetical protein
MTQGTVLVGPITGLPVSPLQQPAAWDTFTVQGVSWQGKVTIRDAHVSWNWDGKHGRSTEGAADSYVGTKPEAFEVTFYLWAQTHFDQWPTFSQLFQYQGTKGLAKPMTVYHPSLALLGIDSVICLHLGGIEQVSEELLYSAKVKLRKFSPPKPAPTISPTGADHVSPPNLPGTPPNPAIARLQAQLAERQRTIASLGTPGGLP